MLLPRERRLHLRNAEPRTTFRPSEREDGLPLCPWTFDDDKNSNRACLITSGVDSAMMLEAVVPLMGLGAYSLLVIAFWGLTSR